MCDALRGSDGVLPGAVLTRPATPAKGLALLLVDDSTEQASAVYAQTLLGLSYAVLRMPAPVFAHVVTSGTLGALARQAAARASVAVAKPVVIGVGTAALAVAALAAKGEPAAHALVSVDYCPGAALAGLASAPDAARPPWYALQHRAGACASTPVAARLAAVPNTHLTWLAAEAADVAQVPPEFTALLQWLDPHIAEQGQASARLRGIPLIELPVANAHRAVIFLSGDGGWAALDRAVGAALVADGIAVLGWDSLNYFWQPRTPATLAADLGRVIDEFHARWHVQHMVVAGYSFGASSVPFAVSRLPAATRALIEKVVLLGPTPTTSFEFHLSQWLGSDRHDSAEVAPEVAKLAPLPVWCLHGQDDTEAQCPPLAPPSRIITLPGDHHFNGDYTTLARLIGAPLTP